MNNILLSDDLFSEVLLKPAKRGADGLYIVSGYASSAMAFHHAERLKEQHSNINIHLMVGMTCRDGPSKANHFGFRNLVENDLSGKFTCSYLINHPPVHSKVYTWVSNKKPVIAFTGSVNYSQQAFIGKSQREVATECDPKTAFEYYKSLIDESIYCNHQDAEEVITLHNDNWMASSTKKISENSSKKHNVINGLEHINVPLVNKQGKIYCLNWGFRKNDLKRNKNEAYIQLTPKAYKSDFFPKNTIHFTISTDDNKTLICTRAQKDKENGNAIETPHNNSLMGEYFRFRLGLSSGEYITSEHLKKYGRDSIDFYKIDEESHHMDFSSKKNE